MIFFKNFSPVSSCLPPPLFFSSAPFSLFESDVKSFETQLVQRGSTSVKVKGFFSILFVCFPLCSLSLLLINISHCQMRIQNTDSTDQAEILAANINGHLYTLSVLAQLACSCTAFFISGHAHDTNTTIPFGFASGRFGCMKCSLHEGGGEEHPEC